MLSVGRPYMKREKVIYLRRRGAVLGRRTPYSRGVPYIKEENILY